MTKRHSIKAPSLPGLLRGKPAMHTDGEGLFLVTTGASKRTGSWKFAYKSPVTGNRTKMTLGACFLATDGETAMGMTITLAREAHQKAREAVLRGGDPGAQRQEAQEALKAQQEADKAAKAAAKEQERDTRMREQMNLSPKDSFGDACQRWADENSGDLDPETLRGFRQSMRKHTIPLFGDKHVGVVTKEDIAELDKAMAKAPRMHKKVRSWCKDVFAWALHPAQKGLRTEPCPVFVDKKLWANAPDVESHPAVTEPDDIRELLLAIKRGLMPDADASNVPDAVREYCQTQDNALLFLSLVGQRSHNVAKSRKEDFDFDAATWTIPAIKMKGKTTIKRKTSAKPHVVYLSRQAVQLLRSQFDRFPHSEWVFPGCWTKDGAMGRTQMCERLEALKYKGIHSPHGFRAMMRTAGEDYAGLNPVVLEAMLGHKGAKEGVDKNHAIVQMLQKMLDGGMPGVYSRDTEKRRKNWEQQCRAVVQGWADWLDELMRPRLALAA
jgi:integrase